MARLKGPRGAPVGSASSHYSNYDAEAAHRVDYMASVANEHVLYAFDSTSPEVFDNWDTNPHRTPSVFQANFKPALRLRLTNLARRKKRQECHHRTSVRTSFADQSSRLIPVLKVQSCASACYFSAFVA